MKNIAINLRIAIERAFGIEIKSHRAVAKAISDLASRKLDEAQFDGVVSLVDSLGDETRILLDRQKRRFRQMISASARRESSAIYISVKEASGEWHGAAEDRPPTFVVQCGGVRIPGDTSSTIIQVGASGATLPLALENLAKALVAFEVAADDSEGTSDDQKIPVRPSPINEGG